MGNIVQPDNAVIDYTTIASMITAIEDLQKVIKSNPSSVTQKVVQKTQWISADKSSVTLDYTSANFSSAPAVVVTLAENDKDKSTAIPPYAFLSGPPGKTSAVVKFSKKLSVGQYITWIAVGTVASS